MENQSPPSANSATSVMAEAEAAYPASKWSQDYLYRKISHWSYRHEQDALAHYISFKSIQSSVKYNGDKWQIELNSLCETNDVLSKHLSSTRIMHPILANLFTKYYLCKRSLTSAPKLRQTVQYSIAYMELKKCKGDIAKITALNDSLTEQVQALQYELASVKERLETTPPSQVDESIKSILEQQVRDLTESIAKHVQDKENADKAKLDIESQYTSLQTTLATMEQERMQIEERHKEMIEACKQVQKEAADAMEEVHKENMLELEQKIAALYEDHSKYREAWEKEKQETIESHQLYLKQAQETSDLLNRQIEDLTGKLDELTKETEEAIEHHEKHMEAVAYDNQEALDKAKQAHEHTKTVYEAKIYALNEQIAAAKRLTNAREIELNTTISSLTDYLRRGKDEWTAQLRLVIEQEHKEAVDVIEKKHEMEKYALQVQITEVYRLLDESRSPMTAYYYVRIRELTKYLNDYKRNLSQQYYSRIDELTQYQSEYATRVKEQEERATKAESELEAVKSQLATAQTNAAKWEQKAKETQSLYRYSSRRVRTADENDGKREEKGGEEKAKVGRSLSRYPSRRSPSRQRSPSRRRSPSRASPSKQEYKQSVEANRKSASRRNVRDESDDEEEEEKEERKSKKKKKGKKTCSVQ